MGCTPSTLNSQPSHRDDLQPRPHPLYGENEVKRTAVFSNLLSNLLSNQLASRENGTAREHGQGKLSHQPNPSGNYSHGGVVGDSGAREPRGSTSRNLGVGGIFKRSNGGKKEDQMNGKSHGGWMNGVKASIHTSDGKTYSLIQDQLDEGGIPGRGRGRGRGRKGSQPYDEGEIQDQDQHHGQSHKQHQHQTSNWTNTLPSPYNEASGSGSGSGSGSKDTTPRVPQPQPHTQQPKKSKQQLKAEARVRWSRTRDHSLQGAAFGFG